MRPAGQIVGAVMAMVGLSRAPAMELSPDARPVLVLQPPQGDLMLAHRALHRLPLPQAWRTTEADRGFAQALQQQLSHGAANWPWRRLIDSSSGADSDGQLRTLTDQTAVIAVVHDELVDLGGKVEFHVTMELVTVRGIATPQESRTRTRVQYYAPALIADSSAPRRSTAPFVMDGPLDEQVNTAAADLSQFLATMVARVSVPPALRPHNPTLGELRAHPLCSECRASDQVVYAQPGRVWVRVAKAPGSILALPLQSARPPSWRTKDFGSPGIP
jgi:hypothetical protein